MAVTDGATWLQELITAHRPDAVRILAFPHAAEYLARAAHAAFGAGSREAAVWLDVLRPQLKTGTPEEVLDVIRQLPMPTPEPIDTRRTVLAYLYPRIEQLRYTHFQKHGYPIGSGMVESGNKLVVEARLKGAGMHWRRTNVNPMLALRGVLCSRRWKEAWPRIWAELMRQVTVRRREGRLRRQALRVALAASLQEPAAPPTKRLSPEPKRIADGRPTEDHRRRRGYDPRLLPQAAARAKS